MRTTNLAIALSLSLLGCVVELDDDPSLESFAADDDGIDDEGEIDDDLAVDLGAAAIPHETDWMSGRYGVGFHYLQNWMRETKNGGSAEWNATVRSFDVDRFAGDIAATGAKWVLFTVGQNSGYYCAPNAALDRHSGYRAGERNSTRDLPMDLANALAARGIELILYLPVNAPKQDARIAHGFGLTAKASNGNWKVNEEFMKKWAKVIEEWSRRYGTRVAGWWFDGAYGGNGWKARFARHIAAAVHSGNRDAVIALNPGASAGLRQIAPEQNYTAGEAGNLRLRCAGRLVDSAQCAIFLPVGSWGGGRVKYTDDEILDYTNQQLGVGGTVTWNLGVSGNGRVNADKRTIFERIRGRIHGRTP